MSNTDGHHDDVVAPNRSQQLTEAVAAFFTGHFWGRRHGDPRTWWNPRRLLVVLVVIAWGRGAYGTE